MTGKRVADLLNAGVGVVVYTLTAPLWLPFVAIGWLYERWTGEPLSTQPENGGSNG